MVEQLQFMHPCRVEVEGHTHTHTSITQNDLVGTEVQYLQVGKQWSVTALWPAPSDTLPPPRFPRSQSVRQPAAAPGQSDGRTLPCSPGALKNFRPKPQ